jgi:predicted O-methyltransferase YrrM
MIRAITPARARRELRLVLSKRGIVARYGGIARSPAQTLRYLIFDRELDNFTYPIANTAELGAFLADILATDAATVNTYIHELATDAELATEIRSRLAGRSDRNPSMPFGRRLGWYAIARIRRPNLIVETGVHDGLGSTVLLRALQRNAEEGSPGDLLSIDTRSEAGWLIPEMLRGHHRVVVGDSKVQLPAAIGDRSVDVFIHDSNHAYSHEAAEFELIGRRVSPGAVLLSDNAHATSAFADYCARHRLEYRFWRERPRGHFYPGAGIGVAVVGDSGVGLTESGVIRDVAAADAAGEADSITASVNRFVRGSPVQ